jgi:hypothetical protein
MPMTFFQVPMGQFVQFPSALYSNPGAQEQLLFDELPAGLD